MIIFVIILSLFIALPTHCSIDHNSISRLLDSEPVSSDVNSEEVSNLPGLTFTPSFKHYSGYLKVSDTRFLHYWYVESQNNPGSDPVVLWLNGGPGCSSLDGLLSELGPFHIRDDGETVYENPYAWNKIANVLFLEAPAGVGYSYSTDGNVTTDDDLTSQLNYNALKEFFNRYPSLKNHDFYITGESYGGIYVPTLAVRVLEGMKNFPLKFKGIAVGNGMLSYPLNDITSVTFAFSHGLIGPTLFKKIEKECCGGCVETCYQQGVHLHDSCQNYFENVQTVIEEIGLNMYDLYRDCAHPKDSSAFPRYWFDMKMAFPNHVQRRSAKQKLTETPMFMSGLGKRIPCLNTTNVHKYLNNPAVRSALHIPNNLPQWSVCSEAVGANYHTIYHNMTTQFRRILSDKVRILVYNGDTDMACNFLMGEKFVHSLKLPLLNETTQWMHEDQIAGFVTQYAYVDFLTVKGAGHMVPQWRAPEALKMITSFIKNQTY